MFALVLGACDDDDSGGDTPDAHVHTDANGLDDGAVGTDAGIGGGDAATDPDPDMATEPPDSNVPASGTWSLTILLVEFGGLPVSFQLEIASTVSADGGGTLDSVELHGVSDDGISDVLVTINDIAVDAEGAFTIEFGTFVVPAAYSPSGSDVELELTISAQRTEDGGFCGGVTGNVFTLETVVTDSTFSAAPTSADAPTGVCPGAADEMLPRIEDCPQLVVGRNEGFMSGGVDRNFELFVPADRMEGEKLPLVFLHHGRAGEEPPWGNVEDVLANSQMAPLVDQMRFILVVPASRGGLAIEWAVAPVGDNEGLAFFDDAITCVDEQFGVDADRIYAMGHSAGGIYTTTLALRRPEVLAAVAAMSPALTIPYSDPEPAIPFLINWGGEGDIAFDTDFNVAAMELIDTFTEGGHFMVACNHGQDHDWADGGSEWMLRFALDHVRGADTLPYADGLPEGAFPDFCTIPE